MYDLPLFLCTHPSMRTCRIVPIARSRKSADRMLHEILEGLMAPIGNVDSYSFQNRDTV
jgi:hypothetical protein